PRPLCPKSRQIADRLSRSRCKLHFGFPEASGQTGGSRTSLTHRKHQSGLGSARPCLAAFAAPLVAASPSSASFAFTPRLSAYSLPSIGAMCGRSLSGEGLPIPYFLPLSSIHLHKISLEIHRWKRVSPLTLTISAASPWP